jgi:transglutaminase superfamily protein
VPERDDELQLRPAAKILAKALEIDPRPLDEGRLPQQRVLGNCRDFTTITTALLRDKGIPARGRCGFGVYFQEGKYIDHWVVEWWDGERWVMTDAQLDSFQVAYLKPDFDPLDVPRDRFIDAGRAWATYRAGGADGDSFGVLDMWGPWFIRGNISRDLASLNKVEMLPWDGWGMDDLTEPLPDEEFDKLAAVAARADFDEVRALYESNDRIRVPDVITSYLPSGPVQVRI